MDKVKETRMPTQKYMVILRTTPGRQEIIGGYMVVAADSYDRAVEVATGCPGVMRPGKSLEIREIAGP
jgi:hypothetical protein